jgi:glycosyltransferase involved in cell wall biosynthesis
LNHVLMLTRMPRYPVLRIAQVAPLAESVPPKTYGGTERVVSYLTEELVRVGHRVTLFASGDSLTSAELVPVVPKSLRLDPAVKDCTPYNCMLVDRVMRRAYDFDVLHFHTDLLHYPCVRNFASRTVTTLHGRLDLPDLHGFYQAFGELPLVSISDAQRAPMPPVHWLSTIPHGLPEDLLAFHGQPEDYFAFLGRISPEKRLDRAILIARELGVKLKISAKLDRVDREYFDAEIKHLLDHPLIEYIGEINDAEKNEFLGCARALLFPIDWPEPFGLVMIEAMACGTPVIAFNCGSVPEILENGVTGFIVNSIDEAVGAAARVDSLDRARIRQCFEQRFTAEHMAANYLSAYRRLLSAAPISKTA